MYTTCINYVWTSRTSQKSGTLVCHCNCNKKKIWHGSHLAFGFSGTSGPAPPGGWGIMENVTYKNSALVCGCSYVILRISLFFTLKQNVQKKKQEMQHITFKGWSQTLPQFPSAPVVVTHQIPRMAYCVSVQDGPCLFLSVHVCVCVCSHAFLSLCVCVWRCRSVSRMSLNVDHKCFMLAELHNTSHGLT